MRVYVDNAATSFPKPPAVMEAMVRFARECGVAPGRGSFAEARESQGIITTCRQRMGALINARADDWIVFAMNCSEALNLAIRGLLATAPPGSHAICTAMEHNSVLRPYDALAKQAGLKFDIVGCDSRTCVVDPDDIRKAIRPRTRLIACAHVSNVTGTIQPVEKVAAIAREHGIPMLIDAAQSAGHVPIDVQAIGADFIAFPGHKGLLGPLGTGMLYIRAGGEKLLSTIKEGGTGVQSELTGQPLDMPHKLEVGSQNVIGIAGLSEALAWLAEKGIDSLARHEQQLGDIFLDLAGQIEAMNFYCPRNGGGDGRTAVFSVNLPGTKPLELAQRLEAEFGVLTRAGLHCAPLAHQTIGTFPDGACRISFGPFTTQDDARHVANGLARIAARQPASNAA
jgi:cysteine desulfurase family protein